MIEDMFENVPESAKQSLLRAKDQTRRTGLLCEPQVLQLRLWPRVVFKDVLDVTIDPLDIEQKTVHYMLRVKVVPKSRDLEKRAEYLEKALHWLLGDDWTFNIKVRQKKGGPGRLVYRGARAVPLDISAAQPKADLSSYEYQNALTSFRRYRLKDEASAFEAAATPLPSLTVRHP